MSDERARAAVAEWIDQQHQDLSRKSYYELLGVPREATLAQIRDAYYSLVARFHPDLFVDTLSQATRQRLISIYSRVVEGYRVLSDGALREQYDRTLAKGKLRWSADDEHAPRVDPAAGKVNNPNARRLYDLAQAALRTGDARCAAMNLKLALSAEPRNPLLLAELAKTEAILKKPG
ncbi:MAG: DnaJ domain-containing protein, partial [Pseudomonadota bacterium]